LKFQKINQKWGKIISNQNKLNKIDLILFSTDFMDFSHFTHQLWSSEHVMNPNIMEGIDIFSVIWTIFDLDLSDETAGLAVNASA
jgi:hypothetical protein